MKLKNPTGLLLLFSCVFSAFSRQDSMLVTLEHAMEIAKSNSPEIQQLELSLIQSRELLNAQNASLKSQFSLTLNPLEYTHDRIFNDFFSTWNTSENFSSSGFLMISQPIQWTDGTLALIDQFGWQDSYSEYQDSRSKTFNNNLYLSYNQPIFTYNRLKMELRELELDLENTSLRYAIEQLALERDVAKTYYDVYLSQLSVSISIEEYNNQKNSYEIIKNKVDAGISAPEELYQAELNLANSRSRMQNQQVALQNQLDQFKLLIGMDLDQEMTAATDISHRPVEVNLQKAVSHALDKRMELRQREIDIENARFDLIRTSSMNEFKGNITLTYGIIGTDEKFPNIYQVPTKNQRASLELNIPLWDWGGTKSRVKAAETVIRSNELSLKDQKNNITILLRQVVRSLDNLITQIEIADQNQRNAQLTYDINLERYRNGDLTSYDLNSYQTQLSQKKIDLVSALIDYKLELLNLKIQSLWDFEKDCSVVPSLDADPRQ